MDAEHLSPRLAAVAELIPANDRIADIGTDHAYLPANLILNRHVNFAIAADVSNGPYQNALSEVRSRQLTDQIDVRLGDGLSVINPADQIDTIILAGMGGELMVHLLEQNQLPFKRIVLQPNSEVVLVRQWTVQNDYRIVAENIVAEGKHFYQMLAIEPAQQEPIYSAIDLKFGPLLRRQKSATFQAYWQNELFRLQQVLQRLEQTYQQQTPRYLEVLAEVQQIQLEIGDYHD